MLIQNPVNVFQWVFCIKIWWAYVGTPSDFATLLRHSTTKSLPTPGLGNYEYRPFLNFNAFCVVYSVNCDTTVTVKSK